MLYRVIGFVIVALLLAYALPDISPLRAGALFSAIYLASSLSPQRHHHHHHPPPATRQDTPERPRGERAGLPRASYYA